MSARDREPGLPPAARSTLMAPFTAAAAAGRLELQACADCGARQWPPREACHRCLSVNLRWREDAGEAQLLATTLLHHSMEAWFRERLPWRSGLVRLASGPCAIAHLHVDAPAAPAAVRVIARVDVSGQGVLIALPPGGELATDWRLCELLGLDAGAASGRGLNASDGGG
jgi:uncharacterized OB-fold protein